MKKIPAYIWILIAITIIGLFLRTYNLREWLYFYPDQARDIMIVEKVVEEGGEWPDYGPVVARQKFKIGPMHYYFQIISGHIFGVAPETMAYPDVFFAVLSIPLFYYFLNLYFSRKLSLALAGLYTVSFFVLEYSRFAWNPNPIPFFILLFLISLWKLMVNREKTGWLWIIILALALGAGVQIHTWLLLLMPATLFFVSIYLIWQGRTAVMFKKFLAVLAIVFALNTPQIMGEIKSDFKNTGYFLELFTGSSQKGQENFAYYLKLDILDHSQANTHILSSLGPKLDFKFSSSLKRVMKEKSWKRENYLVLGAVAASIAFTVFGYATLIYFFRKETNREKKYFLGLVLLYTGLSFIVMHPVIDTLSIRYFIHLVFVPFIFLGFLVTIIRKVFPSVFWLAVSVIFIFLVAANFWSIGEEAREHSGKNRSHERYVVLGEIEPMVEFAASRSPEKTVYFFAQGKFMQNYFKQFRYLLLQKGYLIEKHEELEKFPPEKTIFMLWHDSSYDPAEYLANHQLISQKDFGQIGIYEFKK